MKGEPQLQPARSQMKPSSAFTQAQDSEAFLCFMLRDTHTHFHTPGTQNNTLAGPESSPFSATSYPCSSLKELTSLILHFIISKMGTVRAKNTISKATNIVRGT